MIPALQATAITVRYGRNVAVDGVDVTVPAGGMVGMVGANGAGKSSLVNALAGWSRGRPTVRGTVRLNGVSMGWLAPHRRAKRGLVLVPEGKVIFADLTVAENLALARPPLRTAGRHVFSLEEIFALFPRLADRRDHKGGMLSGGERQMVAVSRALRAAPSILLLDEPSAGLTPRMVHELLATLRSLVDRGLSVLLVEQSVRATLGLVDEIYLLERGKVVVHGPAAAIKDDPRILESLSRDSDDMNLAQHVFNGLVLGSGYALIAIGWTMLLGTARLVNLAHGQLFMLAACLAWAAMQKYGVDYYVAVPLAVLALGLLGVVLQGMMLPLVMQQNVTSLMIVTLGFGYAFQGGAARVLGDAPQRLVSPLQTESLRFGDIWFTLQDVVTLIGTLLLFGLVWLVLNRTRLGARVRAVAEDPKLAQLFGISAVRIYIGVFVFECAAVALAAGLMAPRSPIVTSMGVDEVVLTFVVVVLGGIGSVGGSLLAGFGLGLFTTLFAALVSPAYTTAAAFLLLLLVLATRLRGVAAR